MANNYLQFSFALNDLTDAEITAWEEIESALDQDDNPIVGIQTELERERRELWIYAEEGASPDGISELLSAMLKKAGSDRVVGFTWAETCSKMRINEFSGGAMVVTAKEVKFINAYRWMEETIERMGKA